MKQIYSIPFKNITFSQFLILSQARVNYLLLQNRFQNGFVHHVSISPTCLQKAFTWADPKSAEI